MNCGDSHGQAAACLFRCFLLSHVSTFFVRHQPVMRRLSGGLVRHPRHHQTAERRRCAGPLQCDVIDDTIKLLNDDAALELFVCNIMALAAVVSCVRKTHIGCISLFLWTLFTTTRLSRHYPGRLLCGWRVAAPPGRHCLGSAAPMSCTRSRTPKGCWATTQRGHHCCRSGV